jgi:hypothetical protein
MKRKDGNEGVHIAQKGKRNGAQIEISSLERCQLERASRKSAHLGAIINRKGRHPESPPLTPLQLGTTFTSKFHLPCHTKDTLPHLGLLGLLPLSLDLKLRCPEIQKRLDHIITSLQLQLDRDDILIHGLCLRVAEVRLVLLLLHPLRSLHSILPQLPSHVPDTAIIARGAPERADIAVIVISAAAAPGAAS